MLTKKYFYLPFLVLPLIFGLAGCAKSAKTAKTSSSGNSSAQANTPSDSNSGAIKLFGVPIDAAARKSLRQVLNKAGLVGTKVDSHYFCDKYQVNGQIKKANELDTCYASNGRLAEATYVFPSFMNSKLVNYVVGMIKSKYGSPSSYNGNPGLGDVTAKWDLGSDAIVVFRGWPDETVYLHLINVANYNKMEQEIQSAKNNQKSNTYKSESNAF